MEFKAGGHWTRSLLASPDGGKLYVGVGSSSNIGGTGTLPGFPDGMAIGQHGSWSRAKLSGYKFVFVPFTNGRPSGRPRDILSGFLAPDEKVSYGRPVGVTIGPDGRVLLADDVGDVIWRLTAA